MGITKTFQSFSDCTPLEIRDGGADEQLEWVLASQNGDTVSFNRLVLKWQQKIYNLCLRMIGNPEDASEATQETFLAAFRSIGRFRLDSMFSTWLYRIASNQCLTRLRKLSRHGHESIDDSPDGATSLVERLTSHHDQEQDLYRNEREARVRVALGALPHQQRLTVELKFFQELTFEEIASITKLPLSTVKSRYYAGLQGLKLRLTHFS